MARFLALLAALFLAANPACAQEGRELLRPLAVDLRRLYPDLIKRWDEADLGRFARTREGFRPVTGFLAGPDVPRVAMPRRASGVMSIRRGAVTVERRLLGARPAPGLVEGGLLRYRGAFDHTETLYVAGDALASPAFLFIDPAAPTRIASAVSVRGGSLAREEGGGLAVRDAAGAPALTLAAPVVRDAEGKRRRASWSLRGGAKGDYTVVLTFDPSGLAYPLLVQ